MKVPFSFDKTRSLFLAAVCSANYPEAERHYRLILEELQSERTLSESDQKAINQIQHLFRTFRNPLIENCGKDILAAYKKNRRILSEIVRREIKTPEQMTFNSWFETMDLSTAQYRIMLRTVTTLQLTTGCSSNCRRCNEWALAGARKHFSFQAATQLITNLFEAGNSDFALYGASDPLNWKSGKRTIVDLVEFMDTKGCRPRYGLLTKIPPGTEKIAAVLLASGADMAVSITEKNRKRVAAIEKMVGRQFENQHDEDDLLIPAGLDEDFATIKSSITDNYGTEITPEGAFQIIPTFTSALNLTGQHRTAINRGTIFFLKRKTGRAALPVEYFKPLEALNLNGETIVLDCLLDPQVENILLDGASDNAVCPGMMSLPEFFKSLEERAVLQRKKLIPAVEKRLRQQYPASLENRNSGVKPQDDIFESKLSHYLSSCRLDRMGSHKRYAVSFFLQSMGDYLERHPGERKIILFLRREEVTARATAGHFHNNCEIVSLLERSGNNTFDCFKILLFRMLENSKDNALNQFIKKHPARYDSETGRFVKADKTQINPAKPGSPPDPRKPTSHCPRQ